jgi:hypothetical protein
MRRINPRLLIGILLVVGGFLSLLDAMGVISNAGGIFWGLVFGVGALAFLYLLFNDQTNNWWAAFPGFTLLGLAVSSFLPASLDSYGGLAFFAGISLAFWWVYFTDRERWWAIIPAGVLLTLGVVSVLDTASGAATGGSFFPGVPNGTLIYEYSGRPVPAQGRHRSLARKRRPADPFDLFPRSQYAQARRRAGAGRPTRRAFPR